MSIFVTALNGLVIFSLVELLEGLVLEQVVNQRLFRLSCVFLLVMIQSGMFYDSDLEVFWK